MNTKSIVKSKTLWFNLAAIVVLVLNSPEFANLFEIDATIMAAIITVVNILLRLVTNKALTLKEKQ